MKHLFKRVMDKVAPFGHEDRDGFHLDDPSRDYSYMDERRARIVRERFFVIALCAIALIAGLVVHGCK